MNQVLIIPDKPKNRARFRALMELHEVSNDEASVILGKTVNTILAYRATNGLDISDQLLELFTYKLQEK